MKIKIKIEALLFLLPLEVMADSIKTHILYKINKFIAPLGT